MTCLLDVSTLLAWLWADHEHHPRVIRWQKGKAIAVCPITELGFPIPHLNGSFPVFILGWTIGAIEICVYARPHLLSSPPGEGIAAGRFWFCGWLSGKSSRANFQADGE
jgi:hypothetical protein